MQTELYNRAGEVKKPNTTVGKGRPAYFVQPDCMRCGGMGGSDKWKATGWTCWNCGGSGKGAVKPAPLYTAEKLAALNAAAAKRADKRAADAAAKQAAEAARVEAEREAVRHCNADLIERLSTAGVTREGAGFLSDMLRNVTERAKMLTARQLEATLNTLDKIEAEKARVAKAKYVAEVGERVELELEHVKCVFLYATDGFPRVDIYLQIARTPDGNTVTYKGRWNGLNFPTNYNNQDRESYIDDGAKVRVRATVKEHRTNQRTGEPETVVQRPAVVVKDKAE